MKNGQNENNNDLILELDDIEELEENEVENIKEKEQQQIVENPDSQKNDENENDIDNERKQLLSKEVLIKFLDETSEYLRKVEEEDFSKVYEQYLDNSFITKSHIRDNMNECCLKFIYFIIGPLFGIIPLLAYITKK